MLGSLRLLSPPSWRSTMRSGGPGASAGASPAPSGSSSCPATACRHSARACCKGALATCGASIWTACCWASRTWPPVSLDQRAFLAGIHARDRRRRAAEHPAVAGRVRIRPRSWDHHLGDLTYDCYVSQVAILALSVPTVTDHLPCYAGIMLLSLLLGWVSWRLIEVLATRMRRQIRARKTVFEAASIAVAESAG